MPLNRSIFFACVCAIAAASGCKSSDPDDPPGQPVAGTTGGTGGAGGVPVGGSAAGTSGGGTGAVSGAGGGAGTTAGGTSGGGSGTGGTSGAGASGTGGTGGAPPVPSGCGAAMPNPTVGNPCPGTAPPAIKLTMITDGLTAPTHVAQAPGDATRLYVTEQQGTVRVIKDGTLSPTPLIDLSAVDSSEIVPNSYSESGLLAMVFDPNFATTKRVWFSYTASGPVFIVGEFTMDDPDTLDPGTFKQLVSFPQYPFFSGNATNHVGSMMAFGPDGCLYISRGDGGGENDRQMSGQDTSDDLCSILRIDPDTYPASVAGNHEGHVWNYGFRNPWRFSFDRVTGDLYIGDVGQDVGSGFEEIIIEPRGVPGRNYGWSEMQGSACSGNCDGMTAPAVAYGITSTQNSVIGGYVYRGSAIPGLQGRYVWADWTEREIKTLVYSGEPGGMPTVCDEYDTGVTVAMKVRSFGEDNAGEIYVVAGGAPANGLASASVNEDGALYRIDPM